MVGMLLTSCSMNGHIHIQGLDLQQTHTVQNQFLEWESIISMGNLMLPENLVTIRAPQNQAIGEIGFQKLEDGTNRIAVKVDVSAAKKHFQTKEPQLPNGQRIPFFEATELGTMEIPIFENSRLYINTSDSGEMMAGIALNLPALDRIYYQNSRIPPISPIEFSFHPIFASTGVYLSSHRGQNGVYIFAQKIAKKSHSESMRQPASLSTWTPQVIEKSSRLSDKTSAAISLFRLNYLFSRNATLRIK